MASQQSGGAERLVVPRFNPDWLGLFRPGKKLLTGEVKQPECSRRCGMHRPPAAQLSLNRTGCPGELAALGNERHILGVCAPVGFDKGAQFTESTAQPGKSAHCRNGIRMVVQIRVRPFDLAKLAGDRAVRVFRGHLESAPRSHAGTRPPARRMRAAFRRSAAALCATFRRQRFAHRLAHPNDRFRLMSKLAKSSRIDTVVACPDTFRKNRRRDSSTACPKPRAPLACPPVLSASGFDAGSCRAC